MRQVHQHPDGTIWIRTDDGHYGATSEEFLADTGENMPSLPEGITERVYEPDMRHALSANGSVIDGGPMPWPEGDALLERYPELMAKKQARDLARCEALEAPFKAHAAEAERQRLEMIELVRWVEDAPNAEERKARAKKFNERMMGNGN